MIARTAVRPRYADKSTNAQLLHYIIMFVIQMLIARPVGPPSSRSRARHVRGRRAAALRKLEEMKILRSEPNRGYFLLKSGVELGKRVGLDLNEPEPEDAVFFALASDRLAGKLPGRLSEAELMRLYGLRRGRLLKLLHRVAEEGWIERLPGNGWTFLPALTSREAYEHGYQFRATIESQALLAPSFEIDRRAFAIARNEFFLDALRRVNRLRRLAEYKITVDRSRLPGRSEEHLKILDLLEEGRRQDASDFLRAHILGASAIKSPQVG